ncbi:MULTISPECIES: helix-turn-helix transcriptional regulator [unclassified Saccharopolyspora]|uniref:helix-turn-helix domain-containing protein n=1 Tax=Saccharopolyspora TaxID=1835 RepID=UPI00190CC093|nr:helix-turn-helix transcriptional regulator [Saccharopolyspora sp. HNM0986]MBK0866537.1 helix-turn-helix domain-containing protein [Saccharopolyspora sp. HNM0986]
MTLRRLMLGKSLERWRESAGVTRADIAAELGCTPDRVRHLESGRNTPSRPDLIVMCSVYGVPEDEREVLLTTRSEAQKPGWWQTHRLPKWLANYVTLESEATRVRNWEAELIPGLLQTEAYARRVAMGDPSASDAEVDKRVAARMRRQDRLTAKDDPLNLVAVVSESAIQRCAAERDLADDQLAHLINAANLPHVSIRVMPMDSGIHQAMAGGFVLLNFPADTWPETGHQEYNVGGHLVDDHEAVQSLATLFDGLQERALSEHDTAHLLAQYTR